MKEGAHFAVGTGNSGHGKKMWKRRTIMVDVWVFYYIPHGNKWMKCESIKFYLLSKLLKVVFN